EITDENGIKSVSVYVMDRSLTVINSAGQLAQGENVTAVRFDEGYARLFLNGEKQSSAVVDLASAPPTMSRSPICSSAFLYSFGDDFLLGIGETESGGIGITMYSSENGLVLSEETVAESGAFSKALADKRSVLVDTAAGIIGIPVYSYNEFGTQNSYFVYCYDETAGFVKKGTIEYVDIDDSMLFKRGEILGDTLYAVSEGRIVAARLSDLKVIGAYEY
ncbi:MAG: beta-propeller domain-containing protein, partial [Oscillospiraceae bacterium]|nr:beta-propeller domain-containing protein [Oscillospiraceae bacterium]